MNEKVLVRGIVVVAFLWIIFLLFIAFPPHKPTVYRGRYQGHPMSCMWDTYPPDGDYEVTHGSDGTRGGEYTFWKDGKVVTTCNLKDDKN